MIFTIVLLDSIDLIIVVKKWSVDGKYLVPGKKILLKEGLIVQ